MTLQVTATRSGLSPALDPREQALAALDTRARRRYRPAAPD